MSAWLSRAIHLPLLFVFALICKSVKRQVILCLVCAFVAPACFARRLHLVCATANLLRVPCASFALGLRACSFGLRLVCANEGEHRRAQRKSFFAAPAPG
jgi:hypothetical protein